MLSPQSSTHSSALRIDNGGRISPATSGAAFPDVIYALASLGLIATREPRRRAGLYDTMWSITGIEYHLDPKWILRGRASLICLIQTRDTTEIDFINGYVVSLGRQLGVPTPANAAIVETVHAITGGEIAPDPTLLERILYASR